MDQTPTKPTTSPTTPIPIDSKPPTPMELDRIGSGMWSRWESGKTGALLIVVNREIHSNPPSYVLQILDVQREYVSEVNAIDWRRWIDEKRIIRRRF